MEILTLAPLGALVVIFGLQPGLLLNLFPSTVTETLAAVGRTEPIPIPSTVVIGVVLIVLVLVVARVAWVLLHPRTARLETEGAAAH